MSHKKLLVVHNEPEFLSRNFSEFALTKKFNRDDFIVSNATNYEATFDTCVVYDSTHAPTNVRAKHFVLIESEPAVLRYYDTRYHGQFDEIMNFSTFIQKTGNSLILPSFLLYDSKILAPNLNRKSNNIIDKKIVYIETLSLRNIYHIIRYIKVRFIAFIINAIGDCKIEIVNIKKSDQTKQAIYTNYSAALVIENVNEEDYTSEKLLDAALVVPVVFYLGSKGKLAPPFNVPKIYTGRNVYTLISTILKSQKNMNYVPSAIDKSQIASAHWITYLQSKDHTKTILRNLTLQPASQYKNMRVRFKFGISSFPLLIKFLKR